MIGDGRGVEGLVAARSATHGCWADTANLAQTLKAALDTGRLLSSGQREAIEMICTKLARIVEGDPNCRDHWDDIAGYALLGKSSLR